jgi:uncharacterized protein YciI
MDFLIYCRAARNADDHGDTPQLDEEHWSYMDAFADRMTARGPTLSPDRQRWTGSLHIVALPDEQAAQSFAVNDPYHRAGLFAEHLIWRFDNLLGRTMWDFDRVSDDRPFLVLAEGDGPSPDREKALPAPAERLIVWGALRDLQGQRPCGSVLALPAPDQDAVHRLITDGSAVLGGHTRPEIHAWEFGGRR